MLDPFCGSGTTLVEAQRLGRVGIGFDINPVSELITRAKTLTIDPTKAKAITTRFLTRLQHVDISDLTTPPTVQLRKWYSQSVATDLKRLYRDITVTRDEDARLLKLFCFSSILVKVCRETRHWGYICDNTEPKGYPSRDVSSALKDVVYEVLRAFEERDQFVDQLELLPSQVFLERAENACRILQKNSIDLVVTSPPYFGVVDYVKAQRLSLEWLEHDLERYRQLETGARSKRHRRAAVGEFEAEMKAALLSILQVLKPGRTCAILFGASDRRPFASERLVDIAASVGFRHIIEFDREISNRRRQMPSLLNEQLFVFRKPC